MTCIASFGKYMFVGCHSGIIRVVNMESDPVDDLRPLLNANKSLAKSPVSSIDISPGMLYLVSGY